MAILRRFGLEDLAQGFEVVDGVHEIWNLLSLDRTLRAWFGGLDLWLEGTGKVRHLKLFHSCWLITRVVQLLRALFF